MATCCCAAHSQGPGARMFPNCHSNPQVAISDNPSPLRSMCAAQQGASTALDPSLPSRFAIVAVEMATLYAIGRQPHRGRQIVAQRALNARDGGNCLVREAPGLRVRFGITLADGQRERLAQAFARALQFARIAVIALVALQSVQRAHDPQQIPHGLDRQRIRGARGQLGRLGRQRRSGEHIWPGAGRRAGGRNR